MPKTAGIILVGNEILSGKIEDANAVYLCRELRRLGMDVRKIAVIPDDVDVIATEVARSPRVGRGVHLGRCRPHARRRHHRGRGSGPRVAVVRHPELTGTAPAALRRAPSTRRTSRWPRYRKAPSCWAPSRCASPTIVMRNVYVLPGVPEIFRQKFDAIRERFRDDPIHLKNVFVRIGEGDAGRPPQRAAAPFTPRCCSARTRVLQSRVPGEGHPRVARPDYLEAALAVFVKGLPADAVVKIT